MIGSLVMGAEEMGAVPNSANADLKCRADPTLVCMCTWLLNFVMVFARVCALTRAHKTQ